MKNRYRVLFVITYCILAAVGISGAAAYGSLPRVRLTSSVCGSVDDVVNCSGTVRAANYGVYTENAAMVTNVFAAVGDHVEAGQRLASVDLNDYAVSAPVSALPDGENLLDAFRRGAALGFSDLDGLLSASGASDCISVVSRSESVRAPAGGVITRINALENNYANALAPMFIVTDLQDITLDVKIGESRVHQIQKGQYVRISGSGFAGRSYDGYVESVSPVAQSALLDPDSAYVCATVRVLEPDDKLVPGFTANAEIHVATRENVERLALECILQDESGQEYVYVYDDGVIRRRDVRCDYTASDYAEVSGVGADDFVVYAPEGNLSDGCPVLLEGDWRVW